MKRLISLGFLFLLLLMLTLSGYAQGRENADILQIDSGKTSATVNISLEHGVSEGSNWLRFTPASSGTYAFRTGREVHFQPYSVKLYDADENELTEEYRLIDHSIFMVCELEAAKTYYLCLQYWGYANTPFSLSVTVEQVLGLISAQGEDEYPSVYPHEAFTMRVSTETKQNAQLTYRWYQVDTIADTETLISGASDASCTVSEGVGDAHTDFKCVISDQYGRSLPVYFELWVNNDFDVAAKDEVFVSYGETAKLSVLANCYDGDITYQWYERASDGIETPIAGAMDATFETGLITHMARYTCHVADAYNNQGDNAYVAYFTVSVDNAFEIKEVRLDGDVVDPDQTIARLPNSKLLFEIGASCQDDSLSYQWEHSGTSIDGATLPSYDAGIFDQIEGYYTVSCKITDSYGTEKYLYFNIARDNLLEISPITGVVDPTWSDGDHVNVAVDADDSVTLEALGSCYLGEVEYRWYRSESGDWNVWDWAPIPGETGSSLTLQNVQTMQSYRCVAYDQFGGAEDDWGGEEVFFRVFVDNLTVDGSDGAEIVRIAPNASETLSVSASVKSGKVYYQWHDSDNGKALSKTNTLKLGKVTKGNTYTCSISDDFENKVIRTFRVIVDNGLYAALSGEKYRFVEPGQEVEVSLHTSIINGKPTFKWTDNNDDTLPGDADTVIFKAPTKAGEYRYACRVSDAYGNTRNVSFYIVVGKQEALTPDTPVAVSVASGQSAFYSFAPSATSFYAFGSDDEAANPGIELFDQNWHAVARDSRSLTYRLLEGETYHYRITSQSLLVSRGQMTLNLTQIKPVPALGYTIRVGQSVRIPGIGEDLDIPVVGYDIAPNDTLSVGENSFTALAEGGAVLTVLGDKREGRSAITVIDPDTGVFTLPASLTAIEANAFANVGSIQYLELNENLPALPSGTFAASALKQLVVRGVDTQLEDTSFGGSLLILCPEGSAAEDYAIKNGLPYLYLSE